MKIDTRKIKSIKLFGKTYSVRFVDNEDWSMHGADGSYFGRTDHATQEILIKDRCINEQALDTLLHEVFHIVGVDMGMGLKEKQIQQFATAVTDLLLSNEWES